LSLLTKKISEKVRRRLDSDEKKGEKSKNEFEIGRRGKSRAGLRRYPGHRSKEALSSRSGRSMWEGGRRWKTVSMCRFLQTRERKWKPEKENEALGEC